MELNNNNVNNFNNKNAAYNFNELIKSIEHWNEYRVPILHISKPDKDFLFQGAMRFYFQDAGQKVATKCVKVTSAHTTKDVIDILIEKFRPDMRMLSVPEYGLYEIHENGDERKLAPHERPLFVQLEWNRDDREGRFLLRKMDEKTRNMGTQNEEPSLRRKLSKKEKKKQEKIKKQLEKAENSSTNNVAPKALTGKDGKIAEKLYNELPETSFTRSISNPEAVMKRRRAQKLEKRLQEFSIEGGQEAGGTLRIFGETINKDVSYKTLLLSTRDTAAHVVKQILEKYGKDNEDPSNYCLVQLIVPHSATSTFGSGNNDLNTTATSLRETILEDHECPLLINQMHDKAKGILTFHIRQKPHDYAKRIRKKKAQVGPAQHPLHPLVVQQLNQRLQINSYSGAHSLEHYSDQNSPHNSSQTSGSIHHPNHLHSNAHSHDTMDNLTNLESMSTTVFPPSNGTFQAQQPMHSVSAATLPRHFDSNHIHNVATTAAVAGNGTNFQPANGTLPRQNYSQPTIMNHPKTQFVPNQMVLPAMTQQHQSQSHFHPTQAQQYVQHATGANDQILPALIQVREENEDIFLNRVITHIKPTETAFRLAPTYVIYMVSRYRASTLFHPELQAPSRAELFVPFTKKIATMIRNTIEAHMREPQFLAFWLANSSDLSHFYKQDKHLSHFTIEAQAILNESLKASFKYLLSCKKIELDAVLHNFFNESDESSADPAASPANQILNVLNETMATMRKNRVNTALTIQIFAYLFHHISKWLFDRMIGVHDRRPTMTMDGQTTFEAYCNRVWGERLSHRLALISGWAEKHGLEQAADFHLARVNQLTMFLTRRYSQRVSQQDLKEACEACNRLNPVQLRALLQRYQPEHSTVRDIIGSFLFTMDFSYMASEFPLEEDPELKIPFLVPDDGYSSEMIRYIPNGLLDFVSYLSKIRVRDQELCIFTVQPTSSGFWTVYFKNHQPDTPDIIVIQLRKKNNSMGLSIITARGIGQDRQGVYVKSVVKNGAASLDGRLQAGDQLLEVDGNSLLDISQDTAAELMGQTGPVATLRIAKQAATYHHLSDVINSVPTHTFVSTSVSTLPSQTPFELMPVVPPMPAPPNEQMPQVHYPTPSLQHQTIVPSPPLENQDPRLVQFQTAHSYQPPSLQMAAPNPHLVLQTERLENNHSTEVRGQQTEVPSNANRQVHFQPPAPILYDTHGKGADEGAEDRTNFPDYTQQHAPQQVSPLKSPKKVSWVDTQPYQSLHTLIPPSPAMPSSPTDQAPSPTEEPSPPRLNDANEHYPIDVNEQLNSNVIRAASYRNHQYHPQHSDLDNQPVFPPSANSINGGYRTTTIEEEDEDYVDDDEQPPERPQVAQQLPPVTNGSNEFFNDKNGTNDPGRALNNSKETPEGNLEKTTESLTLEDIDEVLSSKTHNNWLEDSAGVIGTQEVYNDPRQRIVKERERQPNSDNANIEKLSFQEKLKMFNISSKK